MPAKKPGFPLQRYRLRGQRKKPARARNPVRVSRALARLSNATRKVGAREIRELGQMMRQPNPDPTAVSLKLRRLKSFQKKSNTLVGRRQEQLSWLAMHDPEFPRLLNKLFFFERLRQRLKTKGPHSLVYLDVDRLKQVNNRFGRQQGGQLLLEAYEAALARAAATPEAGKSAMAGKIGGDEFVMYLPMEAEAAEQFLHSVFGEMRLEELRKWQNYSLLAKNKKVGATYSAGVVEMGQEADTKQAMRAADILVNYAKKRKTENTVRRRSSIEKLEKELRKKGRKL